MSDGILKVTGFGDFRKLHAEYKKQGEQITKLQNDLKTLRDQANKSEKDQQSSAEKTVASISKMAAAYLSAQQAIQLVNAALREKVELENQALSNDTRLANAQTALLQNMGPDVTNAQRRQMIREAAALGRATPMGEITGMEQIAKLLSATSGELTPEGKRWASVKEAFMLSERMFRDPETQEQMAGFGGAALGLTRSVEGLSVRDAVTIMSAIQGQSRLTDASKLKNLVPGIVAAAVTTQTEAQKQGVEFTPEQQIENMIQMGSTLAALTNVLEDTEGRVSRTAGTSLAMIRELLPRDKRMLPIMDVVEEISGNAGLTEKVLGGRIGEAFGKIGQEGFLRDLFVAENAREIRDSLRVTPEQAREYFASYNTLTPELRQAYELGVSQSGEEAKLIEEFGDFGAMRVQLFGGEFQGKPRLGALRMNKTANPILELIARTTAEKYFDAAAAMGGISAGEAGASAAALYEFMSRQQIGPERDKAIQNIVKEVTALINANKEQADAAANAAAAAAQARAQEE